MFFSDGMRIVIDQICFNVSIQKILCRLNITQFEHSKQLGRVIVHT